MEDRHRPLGQEIQWVPRFSTLIPKKSTGIYKWFVVKSLLLSSELQGLMILQPHQPPLPDHLTLSGPADLSAREVRTNEAFRSPWGSFHPGILMPLAAVLKCAKWTACCVTDSYDWVFLFFSQNLLIQHLKENMMIVDATLESLETPLVLIEIDFSASIDLCTLYSFGQGIFTPQPRPSRARDGPFEDFAGFFISPCDHIISKSCLGRIPCGKSTLAGTVWNNNSWSDPAKKRNGIYF